MNNPQIADIFDEIADILELLGENPFRIRSYRRAAQIIKSLPRELREIDETKWRDVPGIGESMALKIKELQNTGKLKFHQELREKLPIQLLEMLKIPGLGPKTIKKLYDQLNIQTVEQLEEAAKEQKLRKLKGLGAKIEEKIIKGIQLKREYKKRFLLGKVLPFANSLTRELRHKAPVERISLAGSLRRMKETVADVDILVTSSWPEEVIDIFASLPEVTEVLAKGSTKCSILTAIGVQVDLRVVNPQSFGAALHYFTGSKSHNIRIREIGLKKGLKINEYGIFKGDGDLIGGEVEEEIFASVGLPYIPPEIREDWGEIEAALVNKLPSLIEMKDIKGDLHVHTIWSDGAHTIEEMAQEAKKRGWQYMAITDHSKTLGIVGGLGVEELRAQIKEIKKINEHIPDFTILSGVEVDIKADGSLDLPNDILAELDVVIASVHSRFSMSEAEMTRRIIKAMENPYVNILAHPTGRLLGHREPYSVNLDDIFDAALKTNIWMELNSFWDRLDLNDRNLRKAKEKGVKIVISTDAHNTMQLDVIDYGLATARRGWLEPPDVINTYSIENLLHLLQLKR